MSLKCHFDANGWLQGPIAITHMLSPNHAPSGFAAKARGLVFHTEDGFEAGTTATFMNPSAQVSAFFAAGEDGTCQQFVPVGHGYEAWAEVAGNQAWRSCECEDKTRTGDPLTPPQLTAVAQILEACSAYDGFPLQITDDVNGTGLITHGDGGAAWGGHFDCPGDVRKAQRPQIIALAKSIRGGTVTSVPASASAPSVRKWTTAGQASLATLAAQQHTEPSTILRLTAEHSPGSIYPPDVAAWLNDVFAGAGHPAELMPAGLVLYLPA